MTHSGGIFKMAVELDHDVVTEAERPAPNGIPIPASLSAVWLDQDLSWIEFNRRVLAEALDQRTLEFRNLSHRVEVVTPVAARSAREQLWEILDVSLRDRRQAWVLDGDGCYTQVHPQALIDGPESLGTHQTLIDLTRRRPSSS